jgi:hypothetical protein
MSRRPVAALSLATPPAVRVNAYDRRWLYKNDHPRRIDRYFDFFGTGRRDLPAPAPSWALRSLA